MCKHQPVLRHRVARSLRGWAVLCLLVGACSLGAPALGAPADILLENVNVVDVRHGALLPGQDVLISDGLISAVVPHRSQPVHAATVVALEGAYLIPGLWDMHAHIRSYEGRDILSMFVAHGVTGIRDLGLTDFGLIRRWQDEIERGALPGPRIVSSGVIVEGEAPRTATTNPAEYFDRSDQWGRVAPGYEADLVLLNRNPLDDIANTRTIAGVIARGRYLSTEALQELMDAHAHRLAMASPRDLDQAIYMQVQQSGTDGAHQLYPDPLNDNRLEVEPSHLVRFSQVLTDAGQMDGARNILEWNAELFPDDEATRSQLENSAGSSTGMRTP